MLGSPYPESLVRTMRVPGIGIMIASCLVTLVLLPGMVNLFRRAEVIPNFLTLKTLLAQRRKARKEKDRSWRSLRLGEIICV